MLLDERGMQLATTTKNILAKYSSLTELFLNKNCVIFQEAPADECLENFTPPHMKTEFCEACNIDGCNTAAITNGPIALLIAISIVIIKLFTT